MHLVSCTNTHHDVTDLINCEIIENEKTWKSWERNITFLRNKKSLKPTSNDTFHILRSYSFVAEVTLKIPIIKYPGNLHPTLLLRHPQPLLQSFVIEEYKRFLLFLITICLILEFQFDNVILKFGIIFGK